MSNKHDGFGKVHEKFFSSSVMRSPLETRFVFIHLFSCCGADGNYAGDAFAISRHANVPEDAVNRALCELESEDPFSSSREFNGRRIEDVSEGKTRSLWRILNYQKYRAKRSSDDVAAYNANYYREKTKAKRAAQAEGKVKKSKRVKAIHAIAEAEALERAGTENPALSDLKIFWAEEGLRGDPVTFALYCEAHPGWVGPDWRKTARLWSAREREAPGEAQGPAVSDWGKNRPANAEDCVGALPAEGRPELHPLERPLARVWDNPDDAAYDERAEDPGEAAPDVNRTPDSDFP